ncbi:MAG: ABC transporter permease [Actinobacteria bacterium]|jgi:spermidine/putrescine transport system permease protein|nr:ABC transporter permease [Actinomycetota bacterium]NBO35182.1 ABC transporter permease [Actinomycetota bacterium]
MTATTTPIKKPVKRARPGQSSPKLAYLPIIFLAFAIGVPLLIIVVYSFLEKPSQGTGVKWVFTTENYKALFIQEKLDGTTAFDTRYIKVLWTSFYYSLITTVVTLVLSIPVAMWIATREARKRTLLVALVTLPFWISILIRTYGMRQIIADEGPIGKFLGLFDISWSILYSPPATILGLIYVFLPFMILPIYASAERFDFRLAEAAYDLGAKRMTVVRRVILPSIRPGIISGVALVFIPALGSFLQSDMLGGGKTNMVANVIANNFGQARNWPFGSALAVLLIILTLLFVLIIQGIAQRRGDKVELV